MHSWFEMLHSCLVLHSCLGLHSCLVLHSCFCMLVCSCLVCFAGQWHFANNFGQHAPGVPSQSLADASAARILAEAWPHKLAHSYDIV